MTFGTHTIGAVFTCPPCYRRQKKPIPVRWQLLPLIIVDGNIYSQYTLRPDRDVRGGYRGNQTPLLLISISDKSLPPIVPAIHGAAMSHFDVHRERVRTF